jgi:hypothetical protein
MHWTNGSFWFAFSSSSSDVLDSVERSFPSRPESQLPAATFTLESFLRFQLGCCATAAWALHRANVSHNVNFSWLLTSFRIRDIALNSCPIGGA